MRIGKTILALFIIILFSTGAADAAKTPFVFTDSARQKIVLHNTPERVVSLSPTITEMMDAVGAGSFLIGTTYHTRPPYGLDEREIVGGFFSPSVKRTVELRPDLVFLADRHQAIREAMADHAPCVQLDAHSLEDIFQNIETVGRMFGKTERAAEIVREMRVRLKWVQEKVSSIPPPERLRVARFMGRESVMSPGDDSFQTAFIHAAGGTAPQWGENGKVVSVSLEAWRAFNPQVIYGCGGDREAMEKLLQRPGWEDVDAVKNKRFLFYPCDLTCRPSVRSADLITAMAAELYPQAFFGDHANETDNRVVRTRPVDLGLDCVDQAQIAVTRLLGFDHKTLWLRLKQPCTILSTLHGQVEGVDVVGNHYVPPACWGVLHHRPDIDFEKQVKTLLGIDIHFSRFLSTGADMENLAVGRAEHKEMRVNALVTAGVMGNAMRMSSDTGAYYEPGTINIIILTSRALTPRAMARAVITVTEAKTAALQDLDIRSTYQPLACQATGTGTDNIIVVQGAGAPLDMTGGHCKMGELIARAVYQGVVEAVRKQNLVTPSRHVIYRLEERRLSPFDLIARVAPDSGSLAPLFENLMLEPEFAAFMEEAMALEDAWQRGQVSSLARWRKRCIEEAETIAGRSIQWIDSEEHGPLNMAAMAAVIGLKARPAAAEAGQ